MKTKHFILIATIIFLGAVRGAAASAQELPAGIFQMANGAYYDVKTGTSSFSLADFGISLNATTSQIVATSTELIDEPVTSPPIEFRFPLKSAIQTAVAELETNIAVDARMTGTRTVTEEASERPVTLAVWNPKTDEIHYFRAVKNGTHLALSDIAPYRIRVTYTNGLNSTFVVDGHDGETVIAIRYPVYTSRLVGKKKIFDITDVVYVPYSGALHTPQMVDEGERWLAHAVDTVYADIRTRGIHSRAFPERLVADVIDPTFITSILLIEHISPQATPAQMRHQLEAFAVTLAGNRDRSYAYSRSSAGALGLAQFVPSTYKAVAGWTDFGLDPNFERGMRSPVNAIKAQIAYLDYLLSRMPKDAIANYDVHRLLVEEYIAAGYNGGVTRAIKAMSVWEENLDKNERVHVLSRSRLKLETMDYVLKLRAVRVALMLYPGWLEESTEIARAD